MNEWDDYFWFDVDFPEFNIELTRQLKEESVTGLVDLFPRWRENERSFDEHWKLESEVFLDPFMLSIFDDEHSQIEDRWITLGKERNDIPLVVVHTFMEIDVDNCTIRIISARRATKKESKEYSSR